MPWVILGLIAFCYLVPGAQERVTATIEGISSALTAGPVKTITNAWIEIAGITVLAGFAIWYAETKIAKHEGQTVNAPTVAPIAVPAGPQFGGSSGFQGGGVRQEVKAGYGRTKVDGDGRGRYAYLLDRRTPR